MLIKIPTYRYAEITGWETHDVTLPYINKIETERSTVYQVFTETQTVKLYQYKKEGFRFFKLKHDEANESEIKDKAEFLGVRWVRSNMSNPQTIETSLEEFEAVLDLCIKKMILETQ